MNKKIFDKLIHEIICLAIFWKQGISLEEQIVKLYQIDLTLLYEKRKKINETYGGIINLNLVKALCKQFENGYITKVIYPNYQIIFPGYTSLYKFEKVVQMQVKYYFKQVVEELKSQVRIVKCDGRLRKCKILKKEIVEKIGDDVFTLWVKITDTYEHFYVKHNDVKI